MSANGLRAAKWIARVQPQKAAVLAAELRNAVTPASLASGSLRAIVAEQDRDGAAILASEILDSLPELRATVDHVLALADALQPRAKVLAPPDRDSSGGHVLITLTDDEVTR